MSEWKTPHEKKEDVKDLIVISLLILLGAGALLLLMMPHTPQDGCRASEGAVVSDSCCLSTEDMPNTCNMGSCGCSMENSHYIESCACPSAQCFDGQKCVPGPD